MQLTKDSTLCISIAARPSNFGTTLFNKAFAERGLDYIYKAMCVDPDGDLEGVIRGIRALGIRGCGVSMPFKERVIPYMDRLDVTAEKVGSVNTIVNEKGKLIGFNTDYLGVLEVLKRDCDVRGRKVLLCGLGGVALAIAHALKDLEANFYITGRDEEKLRSFIKKIPCKTYPWKDLSTARGYLLINATPIGMAPDEDSTVVSASVLNNFEVIFDVVIKPMQTKLIRLAQEKNVKTISGYQMALEQALWQFQLYTGEEMPRDVIVNLF